MVSVIGVALLPLLFASCGSNSAPDLSPAAKAKWGEYCDYRAACQLAAPCPATTCLAGIAEEGLLVDFVDCQVAKTCDVNDDACVAGVGTTDAERQDFTARCMAVLGAPPTQQCALDLPDPILCTIVAYPIIRKQHLRAVDACLTLPCEQVKACVDAAVEPLNCW